MYIIAKKKDYYDGVAGSIGIDKTIIYERETLEFKNENIPTLFERPKGYWGNNTIFHNMNYVSIKKKYRGVACDEHAYFIVGFCGKLYIGFKLYRELETITHTISTEYTYDLDYMREILEEKTWKGNFNDIVKNILSYDALQMFRDLQSPVFLYDSDSSRTTFNKKRSIYNNYHSKFFVNPLLKDYEFYKVFDSFQAFQEISMFLGGILGRGEGKIIEVDDKYKIAQHGFDKWSFRKESQKGKK